MNASATLRAPSLQATGIGLWVFIAVASTLFGLFLVAYLMRMAVGNDWSAIGLPSGLWVSTALLVGGSVTLQFAAAAGTDMQRARARLLAGGAFALVFLVAQWWVWQSLLSARVMPAGNPAASFFYLLTAMHGLHVAGGLIAWGVTARGVFSHPDPARDAVRIALCARYWHFLLALWAVLFAAIGGLTPEIARAICGTSI